MKRSLLPGVFQSFLIFLAVFLFLQSCDSKSGDEKSVSAVGEEAVSVDAFSRGEDKDTPDEDNSSLQPPVEADPNKVGVILVAHGGMEILSEQSLWDAAVHMFAYDPHHPMYNMVIWNPEYWGDVLTPKYSDWTTMFLRKYRFEYKRMGDIDPFYIILHSQMDALKAGVKKLNKDSKLTFEFDYSDWMSGERPERFAYPRFLYYGPDGPDKGHNMTYCGEKEVEGAWKDCNPERYNVDGPAERLLKKGASKIVVIDITVGGVRFAKTFDVVNLTNKAIEDYNKRYNTTIPATLWVNDPTNLLARSYPTKPENWTRTLEIPEEDPKVPLEGSPNPVSEDIVLAELNTDGIDRAFSNSVEAAKTGVVLFNHPIFDFNECFDPKINDTVTLNKNIKSVLLKRHPSMDPANIVGAFGGIKTVNPENGLFERTREMRAQTLGEAYLYETEKEMPGDEWGYRYWDALEYLKNRGVKHIVIAFPQIVSSSALDIVEIYSQMGHEIGIKTWARWGTWDFEAYPEVGHPFPEYWGPWVETICGPDEYKDEEYECCFTMGGCEDGRPYPPLRQAAMSTPLESLDPSTAYDMSDYGHLGYNAELGAPNPDKPVQDQYTGTWDLWTPINKDPRFGEFLAKHLLEAIKKDRAK